MTMMMATVIIYTYARDYLMAGVSARMLAERQGLKVVLAIDEKDAPFACEHATVVRTGFDRRGNLNGREFIRGHLDLLERHATGPYSIKLDSDTCLLDAGRLLDGKTGTAVGLWVEGMQGMNGCCYAVRVDAIPAMRVELEKRPEGEWLMEDQTMGKLAEAVGEVEFERWGERDVLYDRYRAEASFEMYRARKAVVCFEAREESDRRELAGKMRRLYEG